MWIFTTFGFFSIVEKQAGDVLTVRARVRADLDRLRDRYLPTLSPTADNAGSDYPYRATASRGAVADAVRQIAEDIRYPNFKDAVLDEIGPRREALCHRVWDVMYDAEATEAPAREPREDPRGTDSSLRYGGVVVNKSGEVLLFAPRGHFGGYAWTFPKGSPEPGETPEDTATREVREETGIDAVVIGKLPGVYRGTTSDTEYFLMKPRGTTGLPGPEAEAVTWASDAKASELIGETETPAGRARDLRILNLAREFMRVLKH